MIDDDEDYKYLVKLPMDSVTEENVKKILNERDTKQLELETLKATTEIQLWLNELTVLKAEYNKQSASTPISIKKKIVIKEKSVVNKKKLVVDS